MSLEEEIVLDPEEWRRWVEDGRVPPDAWVKLPDRDWARAAALPEFVPPGAPRPPAFRMPSVREAVFPRRGLSATEGLLLVNLLVAAVLTVLLGPGYQAAVRKWTTGWWYAVNTDRAFWWWFPTLCMHAGIRHLTNNMIALLVTAGSMEFVTGRSRTVLLYLVTGTAGMILSYWGHGHAPISIGASGAIFGLAGATIGFVLRRRHLFTYRQRWKAWRVYVPLFLVLALPSLLQADLGATT